MEKPVDNVDNFWGKVLKTPQTHKIMLTDFLLHLPSGCGLFPNLREGKLPRRKGMGSLILEGFR